MTVTTHTPSGIPAWPFILVEGGPKFGKSALAYTLSASDKVNRTFVCEFGENSAEEYKVLGRYEIVDLNPDNGKPVTWESWLTSLTELTLIPNDGRPNVIIVDTGTSQWNDLKSWLDRRAANSREGRRILGQDPDAAVTISQAMWNDAKSRWGKMLRILQKFDGIAIICCHADEVGAVDDNGRPTGEKTYKIDAEKNILRAVTAHVRLVAYRTPRLMSITSLNVDVPDGGLDLPEKNALEHLVFEFLLGQSKSFESPVMTDMNGFTAMEAMKTLYNRLIDAGLEDGPDSKKLARSVWDATAPGDNVSESTIDMLFATVMEAAGKSVEPRIPLVTAPVDESQLAMLPGPPVREHADDHIDLDDEGNGEPTADKQEGRLPAEKGKAAVGEARKAVATAGHPD